MVQILNNSNFQEVIEMVESLPNEEQEQLMTIIQNRLREKRRKKLIEAVNESRQAFAKGDVKKGTVSDLMVELEEE